jgi:ketosteroid isomerase-like protein
VALTVAGVSGCGGDDEDAAAKDVQSALLEYRDAVEERDYAAICGAYTDDLREEVGESESGMGCESSARDAYAAGHLPDVDAELEEELEDESAEVEVDGDEASIETLAGEEGEWVFEKVDGEWRLADLPPSPT